MATMPKPRILIGKRVLIVEDEYLVALMIKDFLVEFGCATVGPIGSVAKALAAIDVETFDVAVLDVNLAGEKIYPVAETLAARGVPFLLVSGYGEGAIPADHQEWRVCTKPFRGDDLAAMLASVVE
jgi:DNA-binding response OmpR family regulator